MRYTDEGNLRFSGNTRTCSPNQGYYRSELNSGKYAVTLTGLEPGLGYLGLNADEITYDIDNHTLCTCNLEINGEICGDVNICGCLCVNSDLYVDDELYVGSGVYLGEPGDVCIHDICGCDILCAYNGDLCIYGRCYADGTYTYNRSCIEMEDNAIRICRGVTDGAFGMEIHSSDDCVTFRSSPASEVIKFCNGNTIHTTSSCLKLDNDVCVPDIFTKGSGSSTECHYVHTVRLNNYSYTTTDGTLNLGNLTATVGLDGNGSLLITNCTFTEPPTLSVVIGKNAEASADGNIAIGVSSRSCRYGTSVGMFSCACDYALALGNSSKAANGNIAIGHNATATSECFNYMVTRVASTINTGSSNINIGFGSAQLLVKNNTLECDLYNVLWEMINKTGPVGISTGPYLLLDKAIYRNENTMRILGTGDYNIPIELTSSSEISIGNKMTVHKTCGSAISLTCANSYEIWNILY